MSVSNSRIQLRRGLAADWTTANPVLADGEQGYETDTHKIKVGDGTTSWTALPYSGGIADASTTTKGILLLAGDLGGTAATPLVKKINGSNPATVATTGAYADLTGKPTLATVATTGQYSDLIGAPSGSGGGSTNDADFGVVLLDSFTGADDDAKLTAALTAVGADTYKRTILLTNRKYTFATGNRAAFSGMRLRGPGGYSNADKGAPYMSGEVHLTCTGPWFTNNNVNVFDVSMTQMAFTGGPAATVIGNSDNAHSFWRLHMRDISASGLSSVAGSNSQQLLVTGAHFDGFWEINNSQNSAFHIGGSDNRLFTNGGFMDGVTPTVTGSAHLWLDYCDNTVIGPLYITASGPWTAIKIDGPGYASTSSSFGGPAVFQGLQIEGQNIGNPSNGALVRQNGGIARFRDCNFSSAMASPTSPGRTPADAGVIHHADGQLVVDGASYNRATGVAETVPFVYTASAGKCLVSGIQPIFWGGTWTGLPRVAIKSGNTENRITDGTVQLSTV